MRVWGLVFSLVLLFIHTAHAESTADLGTILVEASRSDDTIGAMNKDVRIITAQDIANSPAKSLPDLLGTIPGVYGSTNGNIQDQRVDIGGFGATAVSNVLILVDGRRLNEPDLSGPDLSNIDLNSVDHIEVIQGASTVLFGDNAAGGVINIVTKKGRANARPAITLSSEADSYKGNKEGIDVNGGLSTWTYQFNYDRQQSNNYRTFDNYWANDLDSRVTYDPTDIFGVDVAQGYHLDRYRLPGGMTIADINSAGYSGADSGDLTLGSTSDSHVDVTPHMKFDVGTSSLYLSLFTSARKRLTSFDFLSYDESLNYETESYEFQPKLIVSTPLGDQLENKLTAGDDYIYNHEDRRVYENPEYVFYTSQGSNNIYLLDELTLDEKWLFNAGARGAWADEVFNETQQQAVKLDRSNTTEGYEGGLGYKYNPDSKIFANYAHSYRLPVIDEYFQSPYQGGPAQATLNQGLKYQTGNQYQLGLKDQSFKDLHLGATFTEAQYKDEIYYDPTSYLNQNYNGRTRHYSEQADVAYDFLNKRIQPFLNVTFQQSGFVKGEYSGHEIPFVPDHMANAGMMFNPLKGLSTAFTTHFVGKRYLDADEANTEPKLKRYDTVDWKIRYDFKNIELWFTLQNIFDTRYITYGVTEGAGDDYYYPASGRNAEAGLKVKF